MALLLKPQDSPANTTTRLFPIPHSNRLTRSCPLTVGHSPKNTGASHFCLHFICRLYNRLEAERFRPTLRGRLQSWPFGFKSLLILVAVTCRKSENQASCVLAQ